MSDFQSITDFLDPVNVSRLSGDEAYKEGQVGKIISVYESQLPDIEEADIILVGCNEQRGNGITINNQHAPMLFADSFTYYIIGTMILNWQTLEM